MVVAVWRSKRWGGVSAGTKQFSRFAERRFPGAAPLGAKEIAPGPGKAQTMAQRKEKRSELSARD